MVNRCGTSFTFRLEEETGAPPSEIARAYTAAREIFGMRDLWAEIEALDTQVEAQTQIRMLLAGRRVVERATRWLLRNRRPPLEIAATVSYFSEGTADLSRRMPEFLGDGGREDLEHAAERLVEANVPPELAERVATLNTLFSALDVVDIADATEEPAETAAEAYFTLGDRLRLHWLRHHVEALPRDNRWRALARAALRDDLYSQQAELTAEILRATSDDLSPSERIEAWVDTNRGSVERVLQVLSDINASGAFDLATLSVALRELRNLITSSSATPAEASAR
jgi:glutamate dehydrogenase